MAGRIMIPDQLRSCILHDNKHTRHARASQVQKDTALTRLYKTNSDGKIEK